jgi:hypothetical protein
VTATLPFETSIELGRLKDVRTGFVVSAAIMFT